MRAPLQLDFIAAPGRRRLAGVVVLAAGLALAGELVVEYRDAQQRLQQLETADALLSAARPPRAVPRESADGEMKSAQAVVRQLSLPWAELIGALERAATNDVAVLQIQPDAQQRLLRLTAEARDERLMLEYLRRVVATGSFAEVHLVSHQVREDDPRRPLQFSLQASFRPAP